MSLLLEITWVDSLYNVFLKMVLQAEYILDLQKQLTLLGAEPKNVSNGGLSEEPLVSVTPMHKVSLMLIKYHSL